LLFFLHRSPPQRKEMNLYNLLLCKKNVSILVLCV